MEMLAFIYIFKWIIFNFVWYLKTVFLILQCAFDGAPCSTPSPIEKDSRFNYCEALLEECAEQREIGSI